MSNPDDYEPNLYACPACGWLVDLGGDEAAGDERVVAARTAHPCIEARSR